MAGNRVKVAIVDDDASVRRALCRLLRQMNMDAEPFSSGTEFMESLKRSAPDCLVLDLRMPKTSGWQVLSELRKMKAGIKTIVVSADDQPDIGPLDAAGSILFLTKPVDENRLVAAIAKKAGLTRPGDEKSPS
jgi:FixJ family two-component response regulator